MRGVAATMLMLLVGLFAAPVVSRWHSRQLAARLTTQIAVAKDLQVKIPLRQLASLGDLAIEPLVVFAASEREAVAMIARQIIEEKLATWQLVSAAVRSRIGKHEYVRSSALLASSLGAHVEAFGPAGKQWVERLALALIKMADRVPARQTQALLENCSRMLAAVPPRGPRMRTVNTGQRNTNPYTPDRLPAPEPRLEAMTRSSELSSLEGLALEGLASGSLVPHSPRATSAPLQFQGRLTPVPKKNHATEGEAPLLSSSKLRWSPSGSGDKQQTVSIKPPGGIPLTGLVKVPQTTSQTTTKPVDQVIDIPTPEDMAAQMPAFRGQATEELMLRLNESGRYEAGAIRTVLGERGYTEAELAVWQRLASLDVRNRLLVVDDASHLPATSARRVLRWLLEDEDATVRLRALTALATTDAPELIELARELAVQDEDPRVAELASKLLRRQR